ncbi:MAG: class I tRNA ligase family protein, partial [Pseudomonadota bacterium]
RMISAPYCLMIIRIWVAAGDYTEDPRVGKEIIERAVDGYRKLRNTLRYLLGALDGFDPSEAVEPEMMPELERYMLNRLVEMDAQVKSAYEAFDFKRIWRRCIEFSSLDLSAFYLDIRKDALYCDAPSSTRRRAARTVMQACFDRLTAWLAPICVFTTEEAWASRQGKSVGEVPSVHLRQMPETPAEWSDDGLATKWEGLRNIRRVVTGALELARRNKEIGSSNQATVSLYLSSDDLNEVVAGHDLPEFFITGPVIVTVGEIPDGAYSLEDVPGVGVVTGVANTARCARCWRYTEDVGTVAGHPDLCVRCAEVLDEMAS